MKGYGSPDNEGERKKQRKPEVTKEDRRSEGGRKKRRRTEVTEEGGGRCGGGVWESLHESEGKY